MIKEKKKISKYNSQKSTAQIAAEYFKTIAISVLIAAVITTGLTIKARRDMIKNLYVNASVQKSLDQKMAQQIIENSDLTKDLENKSYVVAMNVGDIYYTACDYENAQIAYEYAVQKVKPGIYKPYYKLVCALAAQEKFDKADALLNTLKDHTNKELIKVKTRSYIVIGDKYFSIGKFLSAAKAYENANFYYSKFAKRDKVVDEAIKVRVVNSYVQTADLMVKSGFNTEAVKFLKRAESYDPDNFIIKYKLAIVLSDSDPEKSVEYFEPMLEKMPQDIDYGVYDRALMKAATIADLDNRPTKAKYYRYKIHSIDMFVNRKVVYKNDVEATVTAFSVRKILFTYPLKATYAFKNVSNVNVKYMYGDFVLCYKDKPVETIEKVVSDADAPFIAGNPEPNEVSVKFKKKIYTKKDLEDYTIKIYLYKDKKYKTLVLENKIPKKSFNLKNKASQN